MKFSGDVRFITSPKDFIVVLNAVPVIIVLKQSAQRGGPSKCLHSSSLIFIIASIPRSHSYFNLIEKITQQHISLTFTKMPVKNFFISHQDIIRSTFQVSFDLTSFDYHVIIVIHRGKNCDIAIMIENHTFIADNV